MSRVNWRTVAEEHAEALADAVEQISALRQSLTALAAELGSVEADLDETAEVMDRWAQEARTAQRVARAVGSLRRGIAP